MGARCSTCVGSDETSTTPSVPATKTDVDPDVVREDSATAASGWSRGPAVRIRSRTVGLAARFSAALRAGRTSLRSNVRAV